MYTPIQLRKFLETPKVLRNSEAKWSNSSLVGHIVALKGKRRLTVNANTVVKCTILL